MDKNLKRILLIIVMLILIAINMKIFINHRAQNYKKEVIVNSIEQTSTKENNDSISEEEKMNNKIAKMDEISRAKVYCGKFLRAIEAKNYQVAYDYLNETYKETYFPTIEEFITYMQNKYPENRIIIKYNSANKKGEVFVIEATIDSDDDENFEEFNQTMVVREIDANNFSISFSKDLNSVERSR